MPITPTPQQIVEIRHLHDQGLLNVRAWAGVLDCGVETVRRIARRETYRYVGEREGKARGRGEVYSTTPAPQADPSPEEIAASLARFQTALNHTPTAREADSLLNELTKKGREER